MSIRTRIAHLLGAPMRYLYKMHLQADILGWQADIELARRQEVKMPELERILEGEIAQARMQIECIDAATPKAQTVPAGPICCTQHCRQGRDCPLNTLKTGTRHE